MLVMWTNMRMTSINPRACLRLLFSYNAYNMSLAYLNAGVTDSSHSSSSPAFDFFFLKRQKFKISAPNQPTSQPANSTISSHPIIG